MITITIRDINGARTIFEYETRSEIIESLNDAIENSIITDEDEILLVTQDSMCLYSALSAPHPITIDDLTGFFG